MSETERSRKERYWNRGIHAWIVKLAIALKDGAFNAVEKLNEVK